jgi:hypothetical protein
MRDETGDGEEGAGMEGIGRILTKYEDAKPQTPIERLLGSVLQIFSPWVPHVGADPQCAKTCDEECK